MIPTSLLEPDFADAASKSREWAFSTPQSVLQEFKDEPKQLDVLRVTLARANNPAFNE